MMRATRQRDMSHGIAWYMSLVKMISDRFYFRLASNTSASFGYWEIFLQYWAIYSTTTKSAENLSQIVTSIYEVETPGRFPDTLSMVDFRRLLAPWPEPEKTKFWTIYCFENGNFQGRRKSSKCYVSPKILKSQLEKIISSQFISVWAKFFRRNKPWNVSYRILRII